MVAAPASHRVLLENAAVRVLDILIEPGRREPVHTHRWPSVMLVDRPARIRYYDGDGVLAFEASGMEDARAERTPRAEWMAPEGPHAVENIDTIPYHAIRIELKAGWRVDRVSRLQS